MDPTYDYVCRSEFGGFGLVHCASALKWGVTGCPEQLLWHFCSRGVDILYEAFQMMIMRTFLRLEVRVMV